MPSTIVNSSSAYGQTSGTDGAFQVVAWFKNSSASTTITANQLVSFDSQTTDIVPTVQVTGTGGDDALIAGVSLESIAPGKVGRVVVLGYAVVKYTGSAPSAGHLGKHSGSTAGSAVFADGAATDVVGDIRLKALGGQIGSTGTCAAWVNV